MLGYFDHPQNLRDWAVTGMKIEELVIRLLVVKGKLDHIQDHMYMREPAKELQLRTLHHICIC